MTRPEEAAKRIFGERAAAYTFSATHTDPAVLSQLVALSHPQSDWRALDVATGTGHTAFAVAPNVSRVVGVDLTREMLAEAQLLCSTRQVTNVDFCEADVHHLPFGDRGFQLVTCRRAAHHFSDIKRALSEMQRMLDAGGRLVIDDRAVPEDEFIDRCMNELDLLHDESHVRAYRPGEWIALLEEAGFRVDAVETYLRHRQITSLTDGVAVENVKRIHQIIDGLDGTQREAFHLVEIDGKLHFNHWYIMLSARNTR